MKTFATTATVAADGTLQITAPLELANQDVEVVVKERRASASERWSAWERLFQKIRSRPENRGITEEDIEREIAAVRSGR